MSNVILKFKTLEGEEIRVAASSIVSYRRFGSWLELTLLISTLTVINVQSTPELLDQILIESYFMLKEVPNA